MSKKNFVFDTNVLLHDPRAIFQFEDNDVVIPIYVIEELDRFKKHANELGRNARQAARIIDQFRREGGLSSEGVALPNGGTLRVLFAVEELQMKHRIFQDRQSADSKILEVALELSRKESEKKVILITKDTNLRIRADALGILAEDYDPASVVLDELYTGKKNCLVPGAIVDRLFDQEPLSLELLKKELIDESDFLDPQEEEHREITIQKEDPHFYPNQFLILTNVSNNQHTSVARVQPDGKQVLPLSRRSRENIWGIRSRNKEQTFALELLLDERVQLITLVGKAGTGKTLLALAAGLQATVEEGIYQKLLVSRPVLPMGRDIGYLPGSMEEKLTPWMQPIIDNVEFLMGLSQQDKRRGRSYQELIDLGMLQIEPLTYIRGRSIPHQYMIVDEAQNLTPHEVKTIISRAGEGTKIVLTGDPYQIDHPYVDSSDNGLVHVVNHFIQEGIAGHVTLIEGERSELAELAANLL